MGEAVTLFRPVGPEELAWIERSGRAAFPPPAEGQPFLRLLAEEAYACALAREWGPQDTGRCFVTRCRVDEAFLAGYGPRPAGGTPHPEYRIPAAALDAFHESLVGRIEVVAEYPE